MTETELKELSEQLFLAIKEDNLERVKILIKKEADLNRENDLGELPLNEALLMERLEIAEELVKSGADVNGKDKRGKRPIHYAVQLGGESESLKSHIDILILLINSGADVNQCIERENFPYYSLHLNLYYFNNLNKYSDPNPFEYYDPNSFEVFKVLIKAGADVNSKGKLDATPLHLACEYNRIREAKILVALGANLDALTDRGKKPLDYITDNALKEEILNFRDKYEGVTEEKSQGLEGAFYKTNFASLHMKNSEAVDKSTPSLEDLPIETNRQFTDNLSKKNKFSNKASASSLENILLSSLKQKNHTREVIIDRIFDEISKESPEKPKFQISNL